MSCKSIALIRVMGALRHMIINAHTAHQNKTVQWNSAIVQLGSVPISSAQLRFSPRIILELRNKQSCFDQINPKRIFFFNHLSFQIISVPMQPNNIWHFARKKSERNALGFEFDGRGFCTAGNTKGFYIELILLINWIFDQWEEF